ncbi:D-serine ammonia-lyase [Sabulicella glaciei]|uniref:Probable D-serine dehydratase n=1 Tax=Sabulicella glaciei TaxID=2984948 RepID=A0ABT3NYX3_9PROT|nr:D-serine ammonia-lyase [Roseococcus sp. MDT2-1-1]MCW8087363.1 D-serine ammonia-lyase [Roseococcus sp. MDT2-1-1]
MTHQSAPDLLRQSLGRAKPLLWLNEDRIAVSEALAASSVRGEAVREAADAFQRWRPALRTLFPGAMVDGSIASPLERLREASSVLGYPLSGDVLLKRDDLLPVAGSVKARGGFHEVLGHAEALAMSRGLSREEALSTPAARAIFGQYAVAVGSTGNLGLAIGTVAAALGFRATVHMSHEAKAWKKARLREAGAEVVEHAGDYAAAVAAGRAIAAARDDTYFVDDENSLPLFLGYAAAAWELAAQLEAEGVRVDAAHPLFVYLPCGVGGAPCGIAFGLKQVFGDAVHCFLAEPVAAPCMLARLAIGPGISVYDIGLDNRTAADGLAVPTASELAWEATHRLLSGAFTVPDDLLFSLVARAHTLLGLRLEPSAVAGFTGPGWIEDSEEGRRYLSRLGTGVRPTHLLWCTGGSLVPDAEHAANCERGHGAPA